MLDPKKLEDLAKQIADAVPPGVKNMAAALLSVKRN